MLAFKLPLDFPVLELPNTQGDSFGFHSNPSKIKEHLNWNPKLELSDGLNEYYKWVDAVPVVADLSNYHPFLLES